MTAPLAVRYNQDRVDWAHVRTLARRLAVASIIVLGGVLLARDAGMVGRAISSLTQADSALVAVTAVLAASTYFGAAVAIRAASGRELPLGRTTAAQLAAACTNRITLAGLGGMATNLRYLERDGAQRSEAVAAIGLTSMASFVVHLLLTALVLISIGLPPGGFPSLPISWPLVALAVLPIGFGVHAVLRHLPARFRASICTARTSIVGLSSSPGRLGLLLVGTLVVTLGHGLAFATAATALGINAPILAILAVFLTGSAAAALAPTPGGLGPLEAALAAGLGSLGAAIGPAVAAVLVFRLITYWFPVLPGAVALRVLRRGPLRSDAPR